MHIFGAHIRYLKIRSLTLKNINFCPEIAKSSFTGRYYNLYHIVKSMQAMNGDATNFSL